MELICHQLNCNVCDIPCDHRALSSSPGVAGAGGVGASAGGVGAGVADALSKFDNQEMNKMSVHEIAELLKVNKPLRTAAEIIAKSHSRGPRSSRSPGPNLAKPKKKPLREKRYPCT